MKEIAFIVKEDSEFHNKYFQAKEERQRFHELAKCFFKKYNLLDHNEYYQAQFLGLKLNEKQKEEFKDQLKKYDDENGMSIFKKHSMMQKAWDNEVTSKINFDEIFKINLWYFPFINYGSYSLWDNDGVIYGYLKDNNKEEIILADYMVEIKMSEYYSVIESLQE